MEHLAVVVQINDSWITVPNHVHESSEPRRLVGGDRQQLDEVGEMLRTSADVKKLGPTGLGCDTTWSVLEGTCSVGHWCEICSLGAQMFPALTVQHRCGVCSQA